MKAAIIGSGIAGLAAAVRLRAKGYEVDVYEANSYTGGKVTALEKNGYRWDAGPSLFTLPELVDELYSCLGEDPRSQFNYVRHAKSCAYFWQDGTRFHAHADPAQFTRELAETLSEQPKAITDYLSRSKEAYDLTRSIFLESSLHKPGTMPLKDVVRAITRMHRLSLFSSLHGVNERTFENPKTQQLFDRYATYNGSSPFETPGIMRLIPHLELGLGTYLPMGGMHRISQSITALAERHGVRFHLNTPVERIQVQGKKAQGVVVEGALKPCDVVVSNMDIVPTYRHLLADQPAPERTLRQERSSSALIFYWGMADTFPELDLHNILFSRDYALEFKQIFELQEVPEEPTIYINVTSKLEPSDAPTGGENWFVMINVPGDTGQDWEQLRKKARSRVIELISKILDRDIEPFIEAEDYLSPPRIQARTGSHQGALYGASSNATMSAFLRHPNFSRRIKNVFFCGGSVHPGGGIPLCLMSAKIVDQLVPSP